MSSDHRPSSLFRVVLPVCAGLAAGVVSSLVLARSTPPASRPLVVKEAPAAADPARPEAPASPSRAATVDRRLQAVEQQVAALGPKHEAPEPPPDPVERERQRKEWLAEQQQRVERLEAEPVDDAWAHATEATIRGSMERLGQDAKHTGKIDRLFCHTTGCVATIEFPSFAEAQIGQARYVTEAFDVRCAQSVMTDTPDDPSAPVKVDVTFTGCARD